MSTYTVLLDACVLYPAPLRSYLMYLAQTGLFRARWSDQIHDEWIRNLVKKDPKRDPAKLQRTRDLMDAHVPDALVTGFEPLIDGLSLPDEDDCHVLAAAIKGQAEGIITFNLKDFPAQLLAPFDITPIHPDEFLCDMFDLNPGACLKATQQQRQSLKAPPFTTEQYLDCLLRQKLPNFVSRLRPLSFAI